MEITQGSEANSRQRGSGRVGVLRNIGRVLTLPEIHKYLILIKLFFGDNKLTWSEML